jgi:phospho-N-acetylmuramoyl-pentapeptide-transferase
MLHWLGAHFADSFGPLRLFTSYLFLAGLGTALAAISTWVLLPRIWHKLPRDRGRAHAVHAEQSIGKPISAGLIFVPIFIVASFLFVPMSLPIGEGIALVGVAMAVGFLDDRTPGGWSEYRLGAMDMVLSLLAAAAVCQLDPARLWLPFIKTPTVPVPPWLFIPGGAALIWLSINATNCTDGVDGLSGSLLGLGLGFLGLLLYGTVGHQEISRYLLLPHYPEAAQWAMLAFLMVGCLAGYLWYNAYPSVVLMGDAGSRPLGLLLGMLVLASGNPFLILVVAFVVLANGATGLLKVALLRFFKIPIFKSVRYPLHDHVRQKYGWSNTQVVVRFVLLQAICMPILVVLLLKVR